MREQDYLELAERMVEDAYHNRCYLSVLVEDIYDIRFWECIIENVKPELKDKIDFPNPTPKGTRGKDVLKRFKNCVNKQFIICIDSDSEYLYDKKTWYDSEFIFHTFVYSKESFQCNPFTLSEICKDITTEKYDFSCLFKELSKHLAPFFYFWLYAKETSQFVDIVNSDNLSNIFNFSAYSFEHIGDEFLIYQCIDEKVGAILSEIRNQMDNTWYEATVQEEIPLIKQKLKESYSITEDEIILFCRGHTLLDKFVNPFINKIVDILKKEKIEKIRHELLQAPEIIVNNTIGRIENISKQDIATKINDAYKYVIYEQVHDKWMKKLKERIITELN